MAAAEIAHDLLDLHMGTSNPVVGSSDNGPTEVTDAKDEKDTPPTLIQIGDAGTYDRRKVPITLLTGYLGAGKSTLLEYILTAEHGYRIAVCMNAKSLTLSNPSDPEAPTTSMLSLPNGCLCCSVKDMGIAAIEEMVAQQTDVDWVVVELTGLADPGPVAKSFWSNEEMGDLVLDGVVCVVDSRNVVSQLSHTTETECERQIASADVILLNKVDLVSPTVLAEVESAVSSINPTLRVHRTTRSRIPLEALFNLRAFSTPAPRLLEHGSAPDPTASVHIHTDDDGHDCHDHSHSHSTHQHSITTILAPLPTLNLASFKRLTAFLESLLWESTLLTASGSVSLVVPETSKGTATATGAGTDSTPSGSSGFEVIRTKGYIRTLEGAYVLQGVADLFEMKRIEGSGEEGDGEGMSVDGVERAQSQVQGKIVFIGRGVSQVLVTALQAYVLQ